MLRARQFLSWALRIALRIYDGIFLRFCLANVLMFTISNASMLSSIQFNFQFSNKIVEVN